MIFRAIVDFLFPPRCVGCGSEGTLLCTPCRSTLHPIPTQISDETYTLLSYQDPLVKKIIHALKYEGKNELAEEVAKMLYRGGETLITEKEVLCIPIPSSERERSVRGYDHIALITESLTKIPGNLQIIPHPILEKVRETKRQVEMKTRDERLQNLKGAFKADQSQRLEGKTILVIDDVTTTGATFVEARRVFETLHPRRIICLALAH